MESSRSAPTGSASLLSGRVRNRRHTQILITFTSARRRAVIPHFERRRTCPPRLTGIELLRLGAIAPSDRHRFFRQCESTLFSSGCFYRVGIFSYECRYNANRSGPLVRHNRRDVYTGRPWERLIHPTTEYISPHPDEGSRASALRCRFTLQLRVTDRPTRCPKSPLNN